MPSKIIPAAAAIIAAATLAACGSSSSSSSSASTSTSASTASSSAAATAKFKTVPVHGKSVTLTVAGTRGRKLTLADVKHFKKVHRGSLHAHMTGLGGLTLVQKINVFLNANASFWGQQFSGGSLPAAHATLVEDQPLTCGSNQITASSAPGYCPSTETIYYPVETLQGTFAPLGDAAILLLTSDLYGYHVENALGAFSKGYSTVQLQEMDSCFAGAFFFTVEGSLQASDEQAVNNYLALVAPTSAGGSTGGATASELSTAFNKGIDSPVGGTTPRPSVCIPS